jgi:hypothetical protein
MGTQVCNLNDKGRAEDSRTHLYWSISPETHWVFPEILAGILRRSMTERSLIESL